MVRLREVLDGGAPVPKLIVEFARFRAGSFWIGEKPIVDKHRLYVT